MPLVIQSVLVSMSILVAVSGPLRQDFDPIYTKEGTDYKVADKEATALASYSRRNRGLGVDKEASWRGAILTAYKSTMNGRASRGVRVVLKYGRVGYADLESSRIEVSELTSVRQKLARLVKVTQKHAFWEFTTRNGVVFSTYGGTASLKIGNATIDLHSSLPTLAQALQKSHAEARAL